MDVQGPSEEPDELCNHCIVLTGRTVPGDVYVLCYAVASRGVAGHGSVLSTRKGYVARLNLHSLKWDDLSFSNEPPALSHAAFETGSPQVAWKQAA